MTPDQDHRPQRPKSSVPAIPIAIVAVVIAAAAWWFLRSDEAPPPQVQVPDPAPMVAPQPLPEAVYQAPDIPQAAPAADLAADDPGPQLPALGESDDFTRSLLTPLSEDREFALWLSTDNLLPKAAAVIDGLSRGNVLRKILPLQPPPGRFEVVREDDRMLIADSNYERYNPLTDLLTAIPPSALARAFHTLRPLLEQAFADLGNPGDKVDNSLIAAIDQILATPEVDGPIALKRESVLYQFADPRLEALPEVQKQLLRIGPANAARIKGHLREVKEALLEQGNGGE